MATCIVVLGMHRTGTSALANVLHRLGVYMGEAFRDGDRHNEGGYWEDLEWRDLNKAVLNGAGGTWYNPPQPEDLADSVRRHKDRILEFVAQRNQMGTWGYKDPRTALLIAQYYFLLPVDQRYVVTSRPMGDVIDSLDRRSIARGYARSRDHWMRLYEAYNAAIDRFLTEVSGSNCPVYRVRYDDLVDRRKAPGIVLALGSLCGTEPSKETIDFALEAIKFRD